MDWEVLLEAEPEAELRVEEVRPSVEDLVAERTEVVVVVDADDAA